MIMMGQLLLRVNIDRKTNFPKKEIKQMKQHNAPKKSVKLIQQIESTRALRNAAPQYHFASVPLSPWNRG